MAANNTANVSVTKGVLGGYCFVAPLGTTLPTDATTALDNAFVNVGFISDEGITHAKSASNTNFFDINSTTIETATSEIERTLQLKFVEMNAVAMGEAYGNDNVTTANDLITYLDTDSEMPHKAMVLELVLKNGRRYRRVFPDVKVTEWGDQVDVSTELAGFDLTYTKYADANGRYEYGYVANA